MMFSHKRFFFYSRPFKRDRIALLSSISSSIFAFLSSASAACFCLANSSSILRISSSSLLISAFCEYLSGNISIGDILLARRWTFFFFFEPLKGVFCSSSDPLPALESSSDDWADFSLQRSFQGLGVFTLISVK